MPKNTITKIEYTKTNQTTLLAEQTKKGYQSNEWLTFLQARELNRRIRKGEHGTKIVRVFDTEKSTSTGEAIKAVKYYTLFNLDQTEAIK